MLGSGLVLLMLAASAEDVPVAISGPFTGPLAALGDQVKHGAEQFVKDHNELGGVDGHRLVLEEGDEQCDPRQAVAVANRFATEHVAVVIGPACSGAAIPVSEVLDEAGILLISPSATAPALTERHHANVFRTIGRDDNKGGFAGTFIAAHYAGQPIAIVQDKSAYGKGLADEVKITLEKYGGTVALYEGVNAGEKDFSALVTKLKGAGIGILYYGGYHPEAALIARQARGQGFALQLIGGDSLNTLEFPSIAGPAGEGTLFTFAPDAAELPEARAVAARLRAQGFEPEGYALYTYAAFEVWASAVEQARSLKLRDLLGPLHGSSFDTVIGPLRFDAKGDLADPRVAMYRWHDGKPVELKP
jgi:branched-chain amino acid transport system substrate-binding protein